MRGILILVWCIPGVSQRPDRSVREGELSRLTALSGRWRTFAVCVVTGVVAATTTSAALAQTTTSTSFSGDANTTWSAQAGDRFVKAETASVFDSMTGETGGSANATWSSRATASADGFADLSVLLERKLYFGDILNASDRGLQLQEFATNYLPNTPSDSTPFELVSQVFFSAQIKDISTGDLWYTEIRERVSRSYYYQFISDDYAIITSIGDVEKAFTIETAGSRISGLSSDKISLSRNTLNYDATQTPPRYGMSSTSIYGVENVYLQAGRAYDVSLSLNCFSGIVALTGIAEPSTYSSGCDAGNSGYWLGLNNFQTSSGGPIALISNDTGLNLSDPSPFAPGGNTAVPEPATWALMIGGFGLAGAALRRRRAAVA